MDTRRRRIVTAALSVPALWLPRTGLAATPACDDATPRQTAGPFYTPSSPEKADFRADDPQGRPMSLALQVVDPACRPVESAVVELWHTDSQGRYDNEGFRLRGFQRSDPAGTLRFATVVPGRYPYRTRHFHLRVVRDGRPVLTTQLYFPDEPGNARDGLFHPDLLMRIDRSSGVLDARFRLVLPG